MAKIAHLSLLFLGLLALSDAFELNLSEPATSVWPMPSSLSMGDLAVYLPSSGFFFQTIDEKSGTEVDSPTLELAYERYNKLIFSEYYSNQTSVSPTLSPKIDVLVSDTSEIYPQLETDESYELTIPSAANAVVQLSARTIYGVLRGLETLSQVIFYDFETGHYKVNSAPIAVQDSPRFLHRGILLDTARHFEPIPAIERLIDAMCYAKFNVLHWHVVDTQSFPFQSLTYPKLWEGAFTARERYRQEEVQGIVEYGRLRGIKVMIEFDVPGHAAAWCKGYPEICPKVTSPQCLEPLDPSKEVTFDLIDSLLSESTGRAPGAGLFPYRLLHLGGDEVSYLCWETNKAIQVLQRNVI
jgi:hexosaminidase